MQRKTADFHAALVTGATSGLGLALSIALLPHASILIIVGRSEEKLRRVQRYLEERAEDISAVGSSLSIVPICYDFTDPFPGSSLYQAIVEFKPDLLINNSGLGWYGSFIEEEFFRHQEIMRVNTVATVEITHHWLRTCAQKKKRLSLCSIASLAASIPTPGMALYGASKSAIVSWMEAIRAEFHYTGYTIAALTVCPGSFKTPFQKKAAHNSPDGEMDVSTATSEEAAKLAKNIIKKLLNRKEGIYYPGKWAWQRMCMRFIPSLFIKSRIFKRLISCINNKKGEKRVV